MDANMVMVPEDLVGERQDYESQKYGRRLHMEAAAHPVLEGRGLARETYSEPSPPNSNVSV